MCQRLHPCLRIYANLWAGLPHRAFLVLRVLGSGSGGSQKAAPSQAAPLVEQGPGGAWGGSPPPFEAFPFSVTAIWKKHCCGGGVGGCSGHKEKLEKCNKKGKCRGGLRAYVGKCPFFDWKQLLTSHCNGFTRVT